ncbi:MAG: hypothetical protein HFF86_10265 [Oscillibacter sp.]|nr:hypothetical protein [Oscillibacter sp.]MCI8849643.1 hypothetical protein [Oscillibacter sp.]
MPLHIYFEGKNSLPDMPIERDIEALFMEVRLDGCEYDQTILREVEKGQYLDHLQFIDRFGRTLPRGFLSTGTKGALALWHRTDVIVWGAEINYEAMREIVKNCTRGALLLPADNYYIECKLEDAEIDVVCWGKHYTSMHEFAEYMIEVAPYEPKESYD